ncbi:MAG: GNAT family N-acetyltransferase [Candidatus Omnitrophica bacterium]|nr:GNAT family N-acetyltransferase [Candidatus Omnitrophota bacterium]
MPHDQAVIIRKFAVKDRTAVRQISCSTALMGDPSSAFFDDDEIFADALTLYFTDYEPESCFVGECDGRVVGYLIGAKDVKRMNKVTGQKIILYLLMKALRRGTLLSGRNWRFFFHVFLSAVKGELTAPSFSKDYPAALHINVMKGYRTDGVGSRLIDAYLNYLKAAGIAGVHFSTMSEGGSQFFKKKGFQLLFDGRRSYFKYFLGKDVLLHIYGMRLPLGCVPTAGVN